MTRRRDHHDLEHVAGNQAAAFGAVDRSSAHASLSVVVPVWNEEEVLLEFYTRTSSALDALGSPWDIVFVDDGSTDASKLLLYNLHGSDSRIRFIRLSRNFGNQVAITAGLDFADGDAVVVMDADLQDPPEVIHLLLDKWREGYDVVHAVRDTREGEGSFKLWTARIFYRLLARLTTTPITLDSGDFRLMDRKVVVELRRLREHHRFMRGLSSWVGFRQTQVPYDRSGRFAGTTKYPLRQMWRLAINAITGFSYIPLQIATYLGIVISLVSLLAGMTVLGLRFFGGADFLIGQTTTLLAVLFIGGIQLLSIGVIGEYLGRTYDEVRGRPLYLVSEAVGFLDDALHEGGTPPIPRSELED